MSKKTKKKPVLQDLTSRTQFDQFNICPKFQTCSAAICPLDSEWRIRSNQNFDRICFYLAESVKTDAKGVFNKQGRDDLFKSVSDVREEIISAHPRIKDVLNKSSITGSRLNKTFIKLSLHKGSS